MSVEDSTGVMHASRGVAEPAANTLRSEVAIVAGIALATLPPNPAVPWESWVENYARIREHIAQALPEVCHDFNARLEDPAGFPRPLPAAKAIPVRVERSVIA
ncbi:anaerobic selenocysteine-containing dehydrogenase [Variovorax sp. 1140]